LKLLKITLHEVNRITKIAYFSRKSDCWLSIQSFISIFIFHHHYSPSYQISSR